MDTGTQAGEAHEPLLIFPCNGNGIEALDCLGASTRLLGFVDDTAAKQRTLVHGYPVHGRDAFDRWPQASVLAVPGSPTSYRARGQIIDGLALPPSRFATIIHPGARVSPLATIGRNVLIMAGTVVTSNAVIGDHVCILPNTVIHHDAVVGDWTLIGSNVTIAGGVRLEQNCYVGSGTSIRNDLCIGAGVLIGLASTIIRDVPPGETVAGSPARTLSRGAFAEK